MAPALESHHLAEEIKNLINHLNNGYQILIVTNHFIEPSVIFEKGVSKGDYLLVLLFNMSFNTLMLTVNQERAKCLSYK